MTRKQIQELSDFDLGILFVKTHSRVMHLRSCPECRRKFGAIQCLRIGFDLARITKEVERRHIDVEVIQQTIDLTTGQERKSVYEAPIILN